ncbi:MAG TPA: M14 metallopeptidase family protein [Thermoanaerobaculia bacterium]|nr:M14 metallopeptidase family protein [Thermoanaerobaculia bacterium]
MRKLIVLAALLFAATAVLAQNAIPTPDEYLGYTLGDRFTPWDRIVDYFNELTRRSPLITFQKIGETYEHRPLMIAVITSQANRAKLDAIRHDVASLANAEVDASRAQEIARNTPAIAWLAFGVHGNESSSAEAAMKVAATLLRDPESQKLLDNLVVVIDPLQNPDGRERYVQWFTRTVGAEANPNPEAYEHAEPWPGGRFNHYLIDMNRDWAWQSQRETQARVAEYGKWNPQVFVDFHEMGANSTYFFPPDAKPINANLPRDVEKWLDVFGRANAQAFTRRGWPFFVAERFDLFYPAYGDSWPSLHGAIGMTYEVAGGGRGGTAVRREDDTVLLLAHRIDEHYTSGMTTLRTAASNREGLLRYFYETNHAQAENGKDTYFIPRGAPNAGLLIARLEGQQIRVGELKSSVTVRATAVGGASAENHTFPAGTAVVSTKQPLGRLAATLLEKSPTFSSGFLEEQQTKTHADEPDDFYDLTSWSMPLAMNVPAFVTSMPVTVDVKPYELGSHSAFRPATYGYIVDAFDPNVYRFAGRALEQHVNFSVAEHEVVIADKTYARGSLIILKGNNPAEIETTLGTIARDAAVDVAPIDSGWTGGTALGSEDIHYVRDPRIALVGGNGISATSYGMLWHTLDIDTPIPHTNLDIASLRNIDLSHYRVLILPNGGAYATALGKAGIEKLKSWVSDGGTVIAIDTANKFLRDKDVEISKLKPWEASKAKKDDDDQKMTDKNTSEKDTDKASPKEERYNEFRIPGSTFRTHMNERSFLTFGLPTSPAVLIEGTTAYQPVTHTVDNIVTIDKDTPLLSGIAWKESLDKMKGAVYLVAEPYGHGQVITFADEPHFRSFWRGTLPLFLNAVLYAPSFPRQ